MKQTISLILSLFLFTSTICVAQTDGKSLAIEGLKYYNGKVVEKNLEKAAGFFRQSAEAGDMVGQYFLGYCYFNGEGVEEDEGKARYWYHRAADNGNEDAKEALVRLLEQ